MKYRIITSLLCIVPLALADEVQLNDGTVYKDCVVESETDKDVTIVVPVAKGIKDSKTIAKDQIKLIIKSTPDEREYAELVRKYGEIEGMSADEMKRGLEQVDKFIADNGKSKVLDKAKELQATLKTAIEKDDEESAKEAEASQHTPEELKRQGYDIEADKLLNKFKSRLKQNNAIPAMLVFDELSQNYGASKAYADARVSAEKILPQIVNSLSAMLKQSQEKENQINKEESNKTTEINARRRGNLTPEQQQAVDRADREWRAELTKRREQRLARKNMYRDQIMKIRDKKMRWFNPIPDLPDSISDLQRVAKDDLDRIKREIEHPESDKAGKGSELIKTSWEALDKGDLDAASSALSEVRALRVPGQYWEALEAEIKAAKTAAYEKARAEREAARAKQLEERRKQQEERRKSSMKELNDRLKEMKDKNDPAKKDDKKTEDKK